MLSSSLVDSQSEKENVGELPQAVVLQTIQAHVVNSPRESITTETYPIFYQVVADAIMEELIKHHFSVEVVEKLFSSMRSVVLGFVTGVPCSGWLSQAHRTR